MNKLSLLALMLLTILCKAQERSSIGVSYGFGHGNIVPLGKSPNSYHQKSFNIVGLNYWNEVRRNLFFETGLLLINYDYVMTSALPNKLPIRNSIQIISVPFKIRYEAGDYIFFNGGLVADVNNKKRDGIGGLGANIGIGLQVKIVNQFSMFLNPQANIHGLIPLGGLFAQSNITFGAAYRIAKPLL